MTRASDKALLRRYHEEGDLAAREQLIEQYLSLVRSLARRYAYRGEQLDDLVQIGCIGLIKAIDRFDIDRGVELTTYATPNIIGEIKRHFRDKGWAVRVPRGLQELNVQLSKIVEDQTVQLGRSPTIPELAKAAGVEEELVLEALESGRAYTSLSLSSGGSRRGRRARSARVARHRGAPVRGLRGPRRPRAGLPRARRARAADPPPALLRRADAEPDRPAGRDLADARLPPDPARAREDPRRDRDRRAARAARRARGRLALHFLACARPSELREGFLSFFEEKGHKRLPSWPLVPRAGDTSTLLTTRRDAAADAVLPRPRGAAGAAARRPSQKCFRTPDIDEVGLDGHHLTFFEMLGNFSFGQYFKEGAIALATEFIQERLQLDWDRVWVTVHAGDPGFELGPDEVAIRHWQEIGMPAERIVALPSSENFWSVGGPGPCGPDSEIYWDWGAEHGCGDAGCAPACPRCDRFLEFWNLVFMEYEQHPDGTLTPLPKQNIDTGMGLERLSAIVQDVPTAPSTRRTATRRSWRGSPSRAASRSATPRRRRRRTACSPTTAAG